MIDLSAVRRFAYLAGAVTILGGGLVLAGWIFDQPALTRIRPSWASMVPTTAGGFILLGWSLWLRNDETGSPARRSAGRASALVAAGLGALILADRLLGLDLGLDRLFVGGLPIAAPAATAPHTALNFILLGSALFILDARSSRGAGAAQLLALAASLAGLLTLVGYLYGVAALIGAMALHTAAAFVLVGAGVLTTRPDSGLMTAVVSAAAGGLMVRRLSPAVIGLPIVVGWVILWAQRAGYFSPSFGMALFAVSLIVAFAGLGLSNARALNRLDSERQEAKELSDAIAERERNISHTLQQALLTVPASLPGIDFGHLYRSATVEAAEVGGDFYDLLELEHDQVGLIIGDVEGKGLQAATLTALVKNVIKAYAYRQNSPADIMRMTNEVILKTTAHSAFMTVFLGILNIRSGALTYCRAGHQRPILIKKTGITTLAAGSMPIGVLPDLAYVNGEEKVEPGEILIMYTDGVTEARNNGDFFGEDRLVEMVKTMTGNEAKEIPEKILDAVGRFSGGKLSDDIAIVAVSPTGASLKSSAGKPLV